MQSLSLGAVGRDRAGGAIAGPRAMRQQRWFAFAFALWVDVTVALRVDAVSQA